ncbi:MAG: hypothetical protein KKA64_03835 [Nanoarchaeota archaeon]|nr:hypothetical protein [Nanoarchaeota archaeon]
MIKKFSKISPTAVFCARMRAKQNLPFAREIVQLIDTKYSDNITDLPDYGDSLKDNSNFIGFIEGRYISLNDMLSRIDNVFIAEIASGLSPRSLEFLGKKDVIYIETELNNLIKLKKGILKDIIRNKNLNCKNLFFMKINPLVKEDMNKIGKFYLQVGKGKQLVLIHEGLLMYFNKQEKSLFRDNIKYLFETYAKDGMWLTPDFSRIKKKNKEAKGKENIRDKIAKVTGREFNYFESIDEAKKFLAEAGFASKIISNEKIISQLIKEKCFESNRRYILNSSEEYRIWKIQYLKMKNS